MPPETVISPPSIVRSKLASVPRSFASPSVRLNPVPVPVVLDCNSVSFFSFEPVDSVVMSNVRTAPPPSTVSTVTCVPSSNVITSAFT